jgi:hypothetical protein
VLITWHGSPPVCRHRNDELVEKGELRAVEVAGLKFYFVDPKEAAEVILGSIKPD